MKKTLTPQTVERLEDLHKKAQDSSWGNSICHELCLLLPLILPVIREHVQGNPEGLRLPAQASLDQETDVSPSEKPEGASVETLQTFPWVVVDMVLNASEVSESSDCSSNGSPRFYLTLESGVGPKLSKQIRWMIQNLVTENDEPLRLSVSGGISAQGSVCEVEPLGEILKEDAQMWARIYFDDADGDSSCLSSCADKAVLTGDQHGLSFDKKKAAALAAHLQAWLLTGSFDLKGLPSSPPSSEDTELLTEARDALQGVHDLHGHLYSAERLVNKWGVARTKCYDTLTKLNAALEASTTSQKGGQGV